MTRWAAGLALVIAATAGAAMAQPAGMSLDGLATLSDAEIVARTMAQIGADVVHVDRQEPRAVFIFPSEPVRRRIRFMLRPHAMTGMSGLCVVPFWDVLFEEKGGERPPRLAFRQLTVENAYRAVGEVGLRIGEGAAADKATEARCMEIEAPDELLEASDWSTAWQAASLAQAIRRDFAGMPADKASCLLEEGCEALVRSLTARSVGWASSCFEGNGRTWAADETCTTFSVRGTRQAGSLDVHVTVTAASDHDPFRWRLRKLVIDRPPRPVE